MIAATGTMNRLPQEQQQQQQQHGTSTKWTKHHRCEYECDNGKEPRLKTEKLSSEFQLQLQLQSLPDEVLVYIGESVAKLCGVRDFLRLSQASRHLKKLLMDSEKTVSNVIRIRASRINHSTMLLPSFSSAPIVIHTLKQLAFYENCCYDCDLMTYEEAPPTDNLLERSHFVFEAENLSNNPFNGDIDQAVLSSVNRVLTKNPSAYVVLEAHSSTRYDHLGAQWFSLALGHMAGNAISNFRGRLGRRCSGHQIRIRGWGMRVAPTVSKSEHPYADMIHKGVGWVELFLCMGPDPDDPSKMHRLELPPRPDFYQNITVPEEREYKQQNDWF